MRAWRAHVDARYSWSDFTKLTETPQFYLLVRPSGNGAAIPKRTCGVTGAGELLDMLP